MSQFAEFFFYAFGLVLGIGFALGVLTFIGVVGRELVYGFKQWNIDQADTRHAEEYRIALETAEYWKERCRKADENAEVWRKRAGGPSTHL